MYYSLYKHLCREVEMIVLYDKQKNKGGNIMENMIKGYGTILEPKQIKEILGIGRNTVYKLLKENKIKNFKIGTNYKIPKKAIEEYIESQINNEINVAS